MQVYFIFRKVFKTKTARTEMNALLKRSSCQSGYLVALFGPTARYSFT